MLLYKSSSKFHLHGRAATSLQDVPFFKYLIEQLPVVATLWNGLMASFALTVAISLLPSLLMFLGTSLGMARMARALKQLIGAKHVFPGYCT